MTSQIISCAYCNQITGEPNCQSYFRYNNDLVWHTICFRCGNKSGSGCKAKITVEEAQFINGTPYCLKCYDLALYKHRHNCNQIKINIKKNKKVTITEEPVKLNIVEEQVKLNINPPADNINICFVGGVSTGKSTILNAIFCEELTQCKIKRTTMVPTIYIENENNPFHITPSEEIFKIISEKNKEIIEKTENGEKISKTEYSELAFNVGKLDINILNDAYVNVYDIPGLNDARTKDIYYNYLEENFFKFNLVIFIVDIHSGLNTSDEIDIVNFITNNTRYQLKTNNKKIYTLVIVNKADDMQLDEDSEETDKLMLTGELNEMYEQVEKTIRIEFSRKNVAEQLIGIMPLCAIDSYLYRMVKKYGKEFKLTPEQILKIGINENGKKFSTLKPAIQEKKVYEILQDKEFIDTMIKLSGFSCLEKTLHKFLGENNTGKTIRINNLLFNLSKLPNIIQTLKASKTIITLERSNMFKKYFEIYQNIKKIDTEMYDKLVSELLVEIIHVLTDKTSNYNDIDLLLADYNRFLEVVFNVYFVNFYNVIGYPNFIEQHVLNLLTLSISNSKNFTVKNIIDSFNTLKNTNIFNEFNINNIIREIVGRSEGLNSKYAVDFYESIEYHDLIKLLSELKQMGIEIMKLLRFIIIYRIKESTIKKDNEILISRKMLYQSHHEIPVYNYIEQLLNGKIVEESVFINGLDFSKYEKEFELDVYYLSMI